MYKVPVIGAVGRGRRDVIEDLRTWCARVVAGVSHIRGLFLPCGMRWLRSVRRASVEGERIIFKPGSRQAEGVDLAAWCAAFKKSRRSGDMDRDRDGLEARSRTSQGRGKSSRSAGRVPGLSVVAVQGSG
jgi:hypothetical protein